MRRKVNIFIIGFKLKDLISITSYYHDCHVSSKKIFAFLLVKLILSFFSDEPKIPVIPWVGPSPNTKKFFSRLSVWNDQLLSTPKITTFLAKSLPKFHEPAPSNATIHYTPTFLITVCYYISGTKQAFFFNLK